MPQLNEIRKGVELGHSELRMRYICPQCKNPFSKRTSNISHSTGTKFCSLQCFYKYNRGAHNLSWRGGPIKYTCLGCGKEFIQQRNKANNPKFCSLQCFGKYNRGTQHYRWEGGPIKYTCLECEKEFMRKRSARSHKFCSRLCKTIYYGKHKIWIRRPTQPEQKVINICLSHNLPYKYVGDGQVWLGNRNPDFVNVNGKKQVIEVFGTYFHRLFDGANRIEHYKKYGFFCLIIWEDELSNMRRVTKKLLALANL